MKTFIGISLLMCFLFPNGCAHGAVLSRNTNLRIAPSTESALIETLQTGSVLLVTSEYPREGYLRVEVAASGKSGWVWKKNVNQSDISLRPYESPPAFTSGPGSRIGDSEIYPREDLTPGKIDVTVKQSNIADNICNKQWSTDSVRPATAVTNKIKKATMLAYGFTDEANHYELDHVISLQNGGCPDCVENLFPQAYGDRNHPMTQSERAKWNRENPDSTIVLPGALEKDLVENHIHDEICRDIPNAKLSIYSIKYPALVSVTLQRGQEILATDWYACYKNIIDGNMVCE